MTIKANDKVLDYDEKTVRKAVVPVFWEKLCSSEKITQADLLSKAGMNKRSFHKKRDVYSSKMTINATLPEICASWLAKDEVLRFRAIVFPIDQAQRKSRDSKRIINRPRKKADVIPLESVRRAILTLLGWNSSGIKTLGFWTVRPHQDNSEVLLSAKRQVLALEDPAWNDQNVSIPNSINKFLMHAIQTTKLQAEMLEDHCLDSFKSPDDQKIGWLLTSCFAFVALIANPYLAKFDGQMIELFKFYQEGKGQEFNEPWLKHFVSCLDAVFSQAERLLLLREGVLRRVTRESIRGFDPAVTAYEDSYPELVRNEQQKFFDGETFGNWSF